MIERKNQSWLIYEFSVRMKNQSLCALKADPNLETYCFHLL